MAVGVFNSNMTFFGGIAVSFAMLVILTASTTAQADELLSLADYDLFGSCTYTSPWTGPTCMEFRGEGDEGWDTTTMTERCAKETDSIMMEAGNDEDEDNDVGCTTPPELAGWCVLLVGDTSSAMTTTVEASPMMISAMADCSGNKM